MTKNEIKAKVSTDPRWVTRAIVAIYNYQTSHEQVAERTEEHNGVGFNGADAEILSSFAKQILTGRTLSQKQLTIAFKKMPKYAGQLERIAAQKGQ